jgi:hypothetical protein
VGNVYVAGAEQFVTHTQIFVATSNRYGESWSPRFHYLNHSRDGERGRPQLATGAAGEVYALWEDTRSGEIELFLSRSLDAGATWLAQESAASGAEPQARVREPALCADRNGNVYVAWRDARAGLEAVHVNLSRDRGDRWLPGAVRVSSVGLARKSAPRLACDEHGGVYVAWVEQEGAESAVYVNVSGDHGETWEFEPRRLGSGGSGRIHPPAVSANDAGLVLVAWREIQAGRAEIRLVRSTDRGSSWEASPATLQARGGPYYGPSPPQVESDRFGHVYVGWQVMREAGTAEFVLKASSDAGRSFAETHLPRAEDQILHAFEEAPAAPFRMHADQVGNVYFSWIDSQGPTPVVGFDRVANYGQTWLGLPRTVGLAGHPPLALEPPPLCADDFGHVYLLWNEGLTLTVAASPFYGDSGWRHEHF